MHLKSVDLHPTQEYFLPLANYQCNLRSASGSLLRRGLSTQFPPGRSARGSDQKTSDLSPGSMQFPWLTSSLLALLTGVNSLDINFTTSDDLPSLNALSLSKFSPSTSASSPSTQSDEVSNLSYPPWPPDRKAFPITSFPYYYNVLLNKAPCIPQPGYPGIVMSNLQDFILEFVESIEKKYPPNAITTNNTTNPADTPQTSKRTVSNATTGTGEENDGSGTIHPRSVAADLVDPESGAKFTIYLWRNFFQPEIETALAVASLRDFRNQVGKYGPADIQYIITKYKDGGRVFPPNCWAVVELNIILL
ncbi:uncharacterized protein KY384_006233 [Bacidia gigantensis]|uniref:uncharacterized protein n=1 Tax=Bacidia gigantensis TaxID=2732470 RepID=UPI001D04542D|nr:uncharacterized protein KY384_006233 [Bacidia gigantensis]KAG8529596.1 hypothetical protein KY384_006233 [Bacidia gigantensis]